MSNVICLVNPQNGSLVLFTILQNSLYQVLLYWGLSVCNFFSFLIAQNELYVGIDFVIANVPMNNQVHFKNEYPDSN